MKRILGTLATPLLVLLLIPVVIVAIPLALISSILDDFMKPNRQTKLRKTISQSWLPAKKYIQITYDEDFILAKYIEDTLLPKYEAHIIVDKWCASKGKWDHNFSDSEKRLVSVASDIIGEYFEDSGLLAITVSANTNLLDADNALIFYGDDASELTLGGLSIDIKDAEKVLRGYIVDSLKAWGISV